MTRDGRTYITVHDGMPEHPKIERLSDKAFRLLVTTWCWSSRNLTDGVVSAASWSKKSTARARAELIDAGLVHVLPSGDVAVHDYTEHQRTADEVKALREKRAEAGRRGGKAKASKRLANAKQVLGENGENEPIREDIETLCAALADAVEGNTGRRPNVTQGWRTAARLMLDRDEVELSDALGAVRWSADNEFWRSNILSLPKLREKYQTLLLQAKRTKPAVSHQQRNDDLFSEAAALAAAYDETRAAG